MDSVQEINTHGNIGSVDQLCGELSVGNDWEKRLGVVIRRKSEE